MLVQRRAGASLVTSSWLEEFLSIVTSGLRVTIDKFCCNILLCVDSVVLSVCSMLFYVLSIKEYSNYSDFFVALFLSTNKFWANISKSSLRLMLRTDSYREASFQYYSVKLHHVSSSWQAHTLFLQVSTFRYEVVYSTFSQTHIGNNDNNDNIGITGLNKTKSEQ